MGQSLNGSYIAIEPDVPGKLPVSNPTHSLPVQLYVRLWTLIINRTRYRQLNFQSLPLVYIHTSADEEDGRAVGI